MKNIYFRFLSVLLVFFLSVSNVYGYWVWSPTEGRFISPETVADNQKSADELFQSALKLREQNGKVRDILRMLHQVVRYHQQSAYAPEAQFLIAVIFEEQQKPLRAAAEFKKVVREYPRSPRLEESIEHLFQIGNLFLTGEKQKFMGVAVIPVYAKAVDIFKFIIEQAPYGPFGDQSQLRLGTAYRKMGNFNEAVNSYQALIANYPSSSLIDEAHYQLAETSYERAQNTSRDQSTTSQASLHLKDFIRQYGTSSLAERAKILKEQLDNQDAEKNYRVGLYYEKQGSIESALIYYEDVAERYATTDFGKKAAERLQSLEQPIRAMERGEAVIQQRIAEVRSMLEAIEQEDKKETGKAVPETGDLKQQLKQELQSLLIAQKKSSTEVRDSISARKRAFKERQKNLREKFKMFKTRKKKLMKNASPELQDVLDKWQASLVAEQQELEHEGQALSELKKGLKKQKVEQPEQPKEKSWLLGWIPGFGKSEPEKQPQIAGFDQKRWNKLQKERAHIVARRISNEKELAKIEVQFSEIEQRELEAIKNISNPDQLLPAALLKEIEKLAQKKTEWEQSVQKFEQAKKEFEQQFGSEFIKNLANESYVSKSAAVNALISGGKDLNQVLSDLQAEQISLSESWLAGTEQLTTMIKAFEEGQSMAQPKKKLVVEGESIAATDQTDQARVLKKRMKYLEREIRSRVDQIQDWKRDNAKRMKKLNQLLQPEGESKVNRAGEKMLMPAKGAYKLTKAFLFGLENNDQKLMEQADATVKQGEGAVVVSNERIAEIRELQEEIELQSILIQGRASEIGDLQSRLAVLKKQAATIPGFTYQSLLIERIPTDLTHNITSAKKLLGFAGKETDIQNRLATHRQQLNALEQKIAENTNKIEIVSLAISQKANQTEKAAVLPFVSGSTETLPQEGSAPDVDVQNKAQTTLIQMKADINIREAGYHQTESVYHEKFMAWYQAVGAEKLGDQVSDKFKDLVSQKIELQEKKKNIQAAQSELRGKETTVVQAQKELADEKLREFEEKLETLKNPSDLAYQTLVGEIRNAQQLRDSLIRDLSTLQSL